MSFLVLLLVGLIVLWAPWHSGLPRDLPHVWVARIVSVQSGRYAILLVLSVLLPLAALLWIVQGVAYGLFTLLLHVALLLLCVGQHDPLRSMTSRIEEALQRDDYAAAALLAEQQLGVVDEQPQDVLTSVRSCMTAACLQDYFAPAFWYLLLGPLGAVAYRLLERSGAHKTQAISRPASLLTHALEWIPARLMALSFALVGQFESTLGTLRTLASEWELSGGQLVARCADAALAPIAEQGNSGAIPETRQLLVRTVLVWAVIIAFLSVLG